MGLYPEAWDAGLGRLAAQLVRMVRDAAAVPPRGVKRALTVTGL